MADWQYHIYVQIGIACSSIVGWSVTIEWAWLWKWELEVGRIRREEGRKGAFTNGGEERKIPQGEKHGCGGNEGGCVETREGYAYITQHLKVNHWRLLNFTQLVTLFCTDIIHTLGRPCFLRWWIGSHIYHLYCGAPTSSLRPQMPHGESDKILMKLLARLGMYNSTELRKFLCTWFGEAYHFCLNLSATFSQPHTKKFSQLCR